MSLLAKIKKVGPSGFGYGSTAMDVTQGLSLEGKTILVTGCNSGLGYETLRVLGLRGAKVIGTARTLEKAQGTCTGMSGNPVGIECELANPASVHDCVKTVKKLGITLDGIICNAGIMALPQLQQAHGYELQFFTNHIGHFILVTGLLELLKNEARVVMLSSSAHKMAPKGGISFDNLSGNKNYRDWTAYGQSKMANLLFSKELARRFAGTRKTSNGVHPGVINTNLGRHMNPFARALFGTVGPLALKTAEQGAATEVYVAVHPAVAEVSGAYFADCNIASSRTDADNADLAQHLWEVSEKIVAEVSRHTTLN